MEEGGIVLHEVGEFGVDEQRRDSQAPLKTTALEAAKERLEQQKTFLANSYRVMADGISYHKKWQKGPEEQMDWN